MSVITMLLMSAGKIRLHKDKACFKKPSSPFLQRLVKWEAYKSESVDLL